MENGRFSSFDSEPYGTYQLNHNARAASFLQHQQCTFPVNPLPIQSRQGASSTYATISTHTVLRPSTNAAASQMYDFAFPDFHHPAQPMPTYPTAPPTSSSSPVDDLLKSALTDAFVGNFPSEKKEDWLTSLTLKVPDLCIEPITAENAIERVRQKTDDVVTRYLPCVDFLVSCQQDLRLAVTTANKKQMSNYKTSVEQFYAEYIHPLPAQFFARNRHTMEISVLNAATDEIRKLCGDAKRAQYQGYEGMKSNFLGGMKDGESWGLRKWLSRHGAGLTICTEIELICRAARNLNRESAQTKLLAERLRPMSSQSYERLKNDVPIAYQAVSTAHPYLPFFHRLESALKNLMEFDPDDDDVIIIEDEEVENLKKAAPPPRNRKRKLNAESPAKQKKQNLGSSSESDNDDVEIIDHKPAASSSRQKSGKNSSWVCRRCSLLNMCGDTKCGMCDILDEGDDLGFQAGFQTALDDEARAPATWDPPGNKDASSGVRGFLVPRMPLLPDSMDATATARIMIKQLETLSTIFDDRLDLMVRPKRFQNSSFWNCPDRYSYVLKLMANILREKEAEPFVEPIDENEPPVGKPAYSSVIKHPLCFRQVVSSLTDKETENSRSDAGLQSSGELPSPGLMGWNMWNGKDLLQAIDLIFLNSLAFNGKSRTSRRVHTNRLRKVLWDGINDILSSHGSNVEARRRNTPIRRGETSGFVIYK